MKRTYKVNDQAGLHARPAANIVAAAGKYEEKINIIYKEKTINLKSMLMVLSLGIPFDAEFEIEVLGDNSEKVLDELELSMAKEGLISKK